MNGQPVPAPTSNIPATSSVQQSYQAPAQSSQPPRKRSWGKKYLLLLLLLLFILFILEITGIFSSKRFFQFAQPGAENEPIATDVIVTLEDTYQPSEGFGDTGPSVKRGDNDEFWYLAELTLKDTNTQVDEDTFVLHMLHELFLLPYKGEQKDPVITHMVYNTQSDSPYFDDELANPWMKRFNTSYYIRVLGYSLDTNKLHENSLITVSLQEADPALIPYLSDSDYCTNDSDCNIRTSFCGFGSFNTYELYIDYWECDAQPYDLERALETGTPYLTGVEDEELGCVSKVEYGGSRCQNNVCTAIDRQLTCQDQ